MSILVVGLNHKSAPVEVREKLAFNPNSINTALSHFSQKYQDQNAEIVILSTCNRVELYISSQDGAIKVGVEGGIKPGYDMSPLTPALRLGLVTVLSELGFSPDSV